MGMQTKSIDKSRTLTDAIRWAESELENAGVYFGHGTTTALDEAAWLVGSAAGFSPDQLETHLKDLLTAEQRESIATLVHRRIETRKPTAYLINEAWFAGLKFYVDERVIVPRSLTGEFIQEQFAPWVDPTNVHRILDLCTGSGCMAIAAAYAFPTARVDAVDISDDALAVARINVERHELEQRVKLVKSNLYDALTTERYDIIVTNPPYVARKELGELPTEYGFEPELALASGKDGLDAILRILQQSAAHLIPEGVLIAEVGNSHETLQRTLPDVPFTWLTTSTGDESVFLLHAAELAQYAPAFARANKKR